MAGDGWSSFMNSTPLGGFFDSGNNNKKAAQGAIGDESAAYNGVAPPKFTPIQQQTAQQHVASATSAGPSAYNNISTDPAYTKAQTQQMQALSGLAANGGRNAASDANLNAIEQRANANAAGQRGAIMQQAAQRGMSGSGNSLLAALSAQQGDISDQNANDLGVAGQQANMAIQAGQGAAGIGAGLQNQAFGEAATKAGANDAQSRFNAGQDTQASEFNAGQGNQMGEFNAGQGNQISAMNNYTMPQAQFGDAMSKAHGIASADQDSTKWNTDQQGVAAKKQAGMWNGLTNSAGDYFGGSKSGADPSALASIASSFAKGGMVPPMKPMGGMSTPSMTTMNPKMGMGEAPNAGLGALDKNPIANPSNKEQMLAALGNLRKKAMGGMP